MPAAGLAHLDAVQSGSCPELSRYASRSYATEGGIRRRCSLLRNIERDKELAPPGLREQVIEELSNRFAVEIEFTGGVGLPPRVVDYLLEYMPETAALVSAYSGKEYTATQVEANGGPGRFFVTDNDTFAAGFTYLLTRTSSDASEYMFFENGRATVLFWSVWGNSFVHYELHGDGENASRYDITIHVFTDSRLLRVILGSGLFRHFARSMFRDVLADIENAVHDFAVDTEPAELLPPYFVTALKRRLHDADGFSLGPRPSGGPWSGRQAQ